VVGVVGTGSPRTEHGGQWFVRRVAPHSQREEPEALLIGGGGVLLLRVGVDQGGVEVRHQRHTRRSSRPYLCPCGGDRFGMARSSVAVVASTARQAVAIEATGPNSSACSQCRHVGQTAGPVGDGHGQVGVDDTGIVGVPVDPGARPGRRHRFGQPAAIGQFGQQCGACVGHQILPVDGHLHRLGGAGAEGFELLRLSRIAGHSVGVGSREGSSSSPAGTIHPGPGGDCPWGGNLDGVMASTTAAAALVADLDGH
jgi:hypothetical protein